MACFLLYAQRTLIATFLHTPRLSSKGTVIGGNTSWIRVYSSESYRTILTRTTRQKHFFFCPPVKFILTAAVQARKFYL